MNIFATVSTGPVNFGPILFRDGNYSKHILRLKDIGFDGLDIFLHKAMNKQELSNLSNLIVDQGLKTGMVAGIWMGAAGINLSHPDETHRQNSIDIVKTHLDSVIQLAGGAPIGFIRGGLGGEDIQIYHQRLFQSLSVLSDHAKNLNLPFYIEPINRYELDTFPTIQSVIEFLKNYELHDIGILADFFHMNIEEKNLFESLSLGADWLLHVHGADSNRLIPGMGHLPYKQLLETLITIGYRGAISLEAFPNVDPSQDAKKGLEYVKHLIKSIGKDGTSKNH